MKGKRKPRENNIPILSILLIYINDFMVKRVRNNNDWHFFEPFLFRNTQKVNCKSSNSNTGDSTKPIFKKHPMSCSS